jgi:hypothetical protein
MRASIIVIISVGRGDRTRDLEGALASYRRAKWEFLFAAMARLEFLMALTALPHRSFPCYFYQNSAFVRSPKYRYIIVTHIDISIAHFNVRQTDTSELQNCYVNVRIEMIA